MSAPGTEKAPTGVCTFPGPRELCRAPDMDDRAAFRSSYVSFQGLHDAQMKSIYHEASLCRKSMEVMDGKEMAAHQQERRL